MSNNARAQEILDALLAACKGKYGDIRPGDGEIYETCRWDGKQTIINPNPDWKYETPVEVDSYGGEGKGESYWFVIHFPKDDVYIRLDGYYASHEGVTWDCPPRIVSVKQKTISVYE